MTDSDQEEIETALWYIQEGLTGINVEKYQELLERTQNTEHTDGSVEEKDWTALRDALKHLRLAERASKR